MNTAQIRVAALLWNGYNAEIERQEAMRLDAVRDLNTLATKYAQNLPPRHGYMPIIQCTSESAELSGINADGSFEFTIHDSYSGEFGLSFTATAEQLAGAE